ncbi:MAG: tetratricopeptide repeat protein [Bacillota bacterium]
MVHFLRACAAALAASLFAVTFLAASALAQAPEDLGWPKSEQLIGKYKAGKYAEVVAEAPAAIRAEPWNNELRLAYAQSLLWSGHEWESVEQFRALLDTEYAIDARLGLANGYAWSARPAQAVPHYRALVGGPRSDEAKLGLANALLWIGRADEALPLFQELRAKHPDTDVGAEGLIYANRAVRAHSTFGLNYAHDNTPTTRVEPYVSHTWRDASNTWIFGLDASGGHDWGSTLNLDRREYGFHVEKVDVPFAPRVTVSQQTEPDKRTFGELRLQLIDWPLYVNVGRVNWGKLAFTVPALDAGLTAKRFGVEGAYATPLGELRGFANDWDISDGNRVENAQIRLTSNWRPLGREIKPYIGAEWRGADHTDPRYWSPRNYGLGFLGVEAAWVKLNWTISGLVQGGFKISGEAATAWAANLGAKRWLTPDWAVGATIYALGGTRQAGYRARGANLILEKLW